MKFKLSQQQIILVFKIKLELYCTNNIVFHPGTPEIKMLQHNTTAKMCYLTLSKDHRVCFLIECAHSTQ